MCARAKCRGLSAAIAYTSVIMAQDWLTNVLSRFADHKITRVDDAAVCALR
jgi:hypothetical protein